MKDYRFDELSVGLTESFTVRVTPEMLADFLRLSGDENPLHTETEFAVGFGYRDRVVYGMLTASFVSKLAGVYLPGRHCLLMEVTSKFTGPVYAGDTLTVTGTVTEINEAFQTVDVRTVMINERGDRVYRGRYRAGFLRDRQGDT